MSSIDPRIETPSLDANIRYARDAESSEAFDKQFEIKKSARAVSDHARVFVKTPLQLEAIKLLTGELQKRRWAFLELPKVNNRGVFFYDCRENNVEQLKATLHNVLNIDCSSQDPEQEKRQVQQKMVATDFLNKLIEYKESYDFTHSQIMEFMQV